LHADFNLPYEYDHITKLCRQQAEVIQNHKKDNFCRIGQGEARHKNKSLKPGGGHTYDDLCEAWIDRGLVYSEYGRIFSNMPYV
jgi:hypothetical protein